MDGLAHPSRPDVPDDEEAQDRSWTYNGRYAPLSSLEGGTPGPKRIAVLTQDIAGPVRNTGVGTAYMHASLFLAGEGHDVTIVYTQSNRSSDRPIGHWIDWYGERGVRLVQAPQRRRLLRATPALQWSLNGYHWLADDDPYDIVHSSECGASPYYSLLAKRSEGAFADTLFCIKTSSPALWSEQGNGSNFPRRSADFVTFHERRCVEMADCVIAPSQHMPDWMREHGYVLPERTVVHPNILPGGAPTGRPDDRGGASAVEEIAFFGRLEERKGLTVFRDAVLREADAIRARGLRVSLIGKRVDGFDLDAFHADLEARSGLAVTVHDRFDSGAARDHLRQRQAVAVIPSIMENSPFVVYECLSDRIAFIASTVGGIPELVDPRDRDDVLFDPSAAALAPKLREIAQSGTAKVARLSFDPAQAMDMWRSFHLRAAQPPQAATATVRRGSRLTANDDGFFEWAVLKQACSNFEDERWIGLRTGSVADEPSQPMTVSSDVSCIVRCAVGRDRSGLAMQVPHEAPHLALRCGNFAAGAIDIAPEALRRVLDAAPGFLRGTDAHLDTIALLARRTVRTGTMLEAPVDLDRRIDLSAAPAQVPRVFDTLATPDFVALARTTAGIELSRSPQGARKSLRNIERHLRHLHRQTLPSGVHERLRKAWEWAFTRLVAPPEETVLENFGRYFDGEFVEGYVCDPSRPERRFDVSLVVDGRVRARTTASLMRSDLVRRGYGDGAYGYRFDVSDLARGPVPVCIYVTVDGTRRRVRSSLRAVTTRSVITAAAERMRRRLDRVVYDL